MRIVGDALLASPSKATGTGYAAIVATIQREQDEAIRPPPPADDRDRRPGHRRIVVALHRAAPIRTALVRRRRIPVVGPSGVFVNYIATVLAGRGDGRSVPCDGLPHRPVDPTPVAAIKAHCGCAGCWNASHDAVPGGPTEL
jgi:hypothetical protein